MWRQVLSGISVLITVVVTMTVGFFGTLVYLGWNEAAERARLARRSYRL